MASYRHAEIDILARIQPAMRPSEAYPSCRSDGARRRIVNAYAAGIKEKSWITSTALAHLREL